MTDSIATPEDHAALALIRDALLVVEFTENGGGTYTCHGCERPWHYSKRHTKDCRVDRALTAVGLRTREERDAACTKLRNDDFDARWSFSKKRTEVAPPAPSSSWGPGVADLEALHLALQAQREAQLKLVTVDAILAAIRALSKDQLAYLHDNMPTVISDDR